MTNRIYFSDVCTFAVDAMRDQSRDDVAASVKVSGSPANLALRLFRRHASAERYAERHGLIGVGVVSFAANRLWQFKERCAARGIVIPL